MILHENIFVDTDAWVAVVDKSDSHHKKAITVYPSLLKTYKSLITSNLVISESYILILNELGHKTAIEFLDKVRSSPRILKIYSDEEIEENAQDILIKYEDQNFSYTDAVSFAVMDYERQIANHICFRLARRVIVPEFFPDEGSFKTLRG